MSAKTSPKISAGPGGAPMPSDMSLEPFFSRLWEDYTAMTSQASRIFESTHARPDHAG